MQLTKLCTFVSSAALAGTLGIGTVLAASSDNASNDNQNISDTNNAGASATAFEAEETKMAYSAAGVLHGMLQQSEDQQIPKQLINQARCIAVFPSVLKAGLVVAGSHGDGLVTCRDGSGEWDGSAPVIYDLNAGSIGAQAGAKTTELVVLFTSKSSAKDLSGGSFKFGADTGVVAGQLGAHAEITTQPAPIVAYRTDQTGVFAGADLKGTVIQADEDAIDYIYGKEKNADQLLSTRSQVPDNIKVYNQALDAFAPADQYQQKSGDTQDQG